MPAPMHVDTTYVLSLEIALEIPVPRLEPNIYALAISVVVGRKT